MWPNDRTKLKDVKLFLAGKYDIPDGYELKEIPPLVEREEERRCCGLSLDEFNAQLWGVEIADNLELQQEQSFPYFPPGYDNSINSPLSLALRSPTKELDRSVAMCSPTEELDRCVAMCSPIKELARYTAGCSPNKDLFSPTKELELCVEDPIIESDLNDIWEDPPAAVMPVIEPRVEEAVFAKPLPRVATMPVFKPRVEEDKPPVTVVPVVKLTQATIASAAPATVIISKHKKLKVHFEMEPCRVCENDSESQAPCKKPPLCTSCVKKSKKIEDNARYAREKVEKELGVKFKHIKEYTGVIDGRCVNMIKKAYNLMNERQKYNLYPKSPLVWGNDPLPAETEDETVDQTDKQQVCLSVCSTAVSVPLESPPEPVEDLTQGATDKYQALLDAHKALMLKCERLEAAQKAATQKAIEETAEQLRAPGEMLDVHGDAVEI
jgi:hypothetical protein